LSCDDSYDHISRLQYEEIDRLKNELQTNTESSKKDKQKLQEIILNKEKEVYSIVQEQEQLKRELSTMSQTENERREIASASEQQLKVSSTKHWKGLC